MNSLIYKALNRAKRSIRLIEIQSGDTELVSCVFHVVDLSDCPAYIALSYAWGPPPSPVTILIDGQAIAIRENLYLALRSIRNQRYVKGAAEFNDCRFFWIDAICIDQENILERNHQVELMSTLYSQAHSVIAWLGPEADDSWMAMIYFQRIGRKTTGDILSILASSGLWQDTPRHVAISAVLERGYWKRLWIIQEIVLAPQVVFLCGN
ncbi:HET-domain-containing protein, partial [Acephala macrosclerotiorum]